MLPIETINAVFPSSVRVGATSLGAMTLLHAVALEAFGITVGDRYADGKSKAITAAWILSLGADELKDCVEGRIGKAETLAWSRKNGIGAKEAEKAVGSAFASAFLNYVPPKKDSNEIRFDDMQDGYGWPLELTDMIAHEYGRSQEDVMRMPLATVFATIAVMRQRYGGESDGPDYYDRIRQARFTEMVRREREAGKGKSEEGKGKQEEGK